MFKSLKVFDSRISKDYLNISVEVSLDPTLVKYVQEFTPALFKFYVIDKILENFRDEEPCKATMSFINSLDPKDFCLGVCIPSLHPGNTNLSMLVFHMPYKKVLQTLKR